MHYKDDSKQAKNGRMNNQTNKNPQSKHKTPKNTLLIQWHNMSPEGKRVNGSNLW